MASFIAAKDLFSCQLAAFSMCPIKQGNCCVGNSAVKYEVVCFPFTIMCVSNSTGMYVCVCVVCVCLRVSALKVFACALACVSLSVFAYVLACMCVRASVCVRSCVKCVACVTLSQRDYANAIRVSLSVQRRSG